MNKKSDPITQRIIDIMKQGRNPKSVLQWIPLEIVLRTGSSQQKWNFDKKLIETLEQWWQNKFGTKITGLDRTSGAAGPHSKEAPKTRTANIFVPDVPINWRILKTLISKGCSYPQMINILNTQYMMTVTKDDILNNINYHWPFLAEGATRQRRSSRFQTVLKDAKYYFIAPIVRSHVENGITNTLEIANLFKSAENPQGLSPQSITRAIKKEYQVNSWAGFLKLCGAPLSPQSLQHLTPQEYRDAGGTSKEAYEKFVISQFIIQGLTERDIANQMPEIAFSSVTRRIAMWWGDMYNARKQLVGPILALCFKKGWSSAQIRANVPFFQNRFSGSHPSTGVKHFSIQWFGINPGVAKNFLVAHNLNWFLTSFFY